MVNTPKNEDTGLPKKKKSKSKNKNKAGKSKKKAQDTLSPVLTETTIPANEVTEVEPVLETVFTLPVKPDEWLIKPAVYDEEGNVETPERFVFMKDDLEVVTINFTQENFTGLTAILRERFTDESVEADLFHIRNPYTEDGNDNPVMTLTRHGTILATTQLDQPTLKKLIRTLQRNVKRKTPFTQWANNWWNKHKVLRVFAIIGGLPVALVVLYSIFWGLGH